MPAEWEPHEATWLGWPHEVTDWPGKFAPIPWAFAEIVRVLSAVSAFTCWCRTASGIAGRSILKKAGAKLERGAFFSCADGPRMDAGFRADLRAESARRSGVQQFFV